eukprot:scpid20435/ scgid0225/ Phosphatidylinositide phosphatase SAC2; Inositol polyphosphate 5-phosphatase F; Sac domain-containing inositol phosphatase 2; Sac domain-containing phosphoinositide 5-phosphatase 2
MDGLNSGCELFETVDAFILKGRESCLWCNRLDGRLIVRSLSEFKNAWEPISLGIVYGCIGKIRLLSDGEWRLLLISHRTPVGRNVNGHSMYRIDRAAAISMAPDDASELELDVNNQSQLVNQKSRLKRLNNPRQKAFLQTLSTYRASQTLKPKKEQKELEKIEKRLLEELLKMFNSESFFFCPNDDLTSSVQRMGDPSYNADLPIWKRADDRFFWNKNMLTDLLKAESLHTDGLLDEWIMPIIQGHVETHQCSIVDGGDGAGGQASTSASESSSQGRANPMSTLSRFARRSVFREQSHGDSTANQRTDDQQRDHGQAAGASPGGGDIEEDDSRFTLHVISRRSRFRAGTRFLRRGVDETGAVANFVETEQIVVVRTHTVSFVQIRGSIPVFWSQLGLKYRPPPKIDRSDQESQKAFKEHFDDQLSQYGKVAVISLVEQHGREKIMADAFVKHMDLYNNDDSLFISFDFHEHCKGMHFENVENLVDALDPIIRSHRYCWRDKEGILCQQLGIMRINCMDCLDRTNVVMCAMARRVLLTLLFKLGLLSPDSILPSATRSTFQMMWANNGDAISRQYAGTAALKGDFTRTGERSMMGVMKDGYNSASRYYVNHFRDVYRQTVIDLMLGNAVSVDLLRLARSESVGDMAVISPEADEWTMEREESVAESIMKCKRLLVPDEEDTAQGWAVVEHGPCSGLLDTHDDIDLVLLLVNDALFVAMYDYEFDDVSQYERIPLEDLHSFQLGVLSSLGKSSQTVFLRLLRRQKGESGFFYTVKPIHSHSSAEAMESLQGIAQSIQDARASAGRPTLPYHETKLSKNRSKRPSDLVVLSQSQMKQPWSWKPRRVDTSNNSNSDAANSGPGPEKERGRAVTRLLNVGLSTLRKHSPSGVRGETDTEDNVDESQSPRVRLKQEGRRVITQVRRLMRNEAAAANSDTEECDSPLTGSSILIPVASTAAASAVVGDPVPEAQAVDAVVCAPVGSSMAMPISDGGPAAAAEHNSQNEIETVATSSAGGNMSSPDNSSDTSISEGHAVRKRMVRARSSQVGDEELIIARELCKRLSPPIGTVSSPRDTPTSTSSHLSEDS